MTAIKKKAELPCKKLISLFLASGGKGWPVHRDLK